MDDEGIVVTTVDTVSTTPVDVKPTEPVETPVELTAEQKAQKEFDNRAAAQKAQYKRELARNQRELQAEREARIRAEERASIHAPKPEVKADASERPKLANFTDVEEWADAVAEWKADQRINHALAEREKKDVAEKANAAQQQSAAGFQKRLATILDEIPDYNDVVSSVEVPVSQAMQAVILESEKGPHLNHYLRLHPDEAQAISQMTPIGAVRALTRIEDGFKTKPITKTPEPITPTGARQTSGVKALRDVTSQAEFEDRRRKFIAGKR